MAPGIEFTLSLGRIPLITFTLRQWHFHFNDRLALPSASAGSTANIATSIPASHLISPTPPPPPSLSLCPYQRDSIAARSLKYVSHCRRNTTLARIACNCWHQVARSRSRFARSTRNLDSTTAKAQSVASAIFPLQLLAISKHDE